MDSAANDLKEVASRQWFYSFSLPDGSQTSTYISDEVESIHRTRLEMLESELAPILARSDEKLDAVDIASHQGWYSVQLARMGCRQVVGVEPRSQHIDDSRLISRALGLDNVRFVQSDIDGLAEADVEPADIVLMLGLIYHLENPVGAIRAARALCKKVCLIETQVGPHVSGMLDWGNHEFVRPIKGNFSVIDETDETHAPEASLGGICLAPSPETLLWIMQKVGFHSVRLVMPPQDGYEQLRHFKRVMAIGFVD